MKWLKSLFRFISGAWIDDIVFGIKEQTKFLNENVEKLRQRAILDGEERYFEKHDDSSSG